MSREIKNQEYYIDGNNKCSYDVLFIDERGDILFIAEVANENHAQLFIELLNNS